MISSPSRILVHHIFCIDAKLAVHVPDYVNPNGLVLHLTKVSRTLWINLGQIDFPTDQKVFLSAV